MTGLWGGSIKWIVSPALSMGPRENSRTWSQSRCSWNVEEKGVSS